GLGRQIDLDPLERHALFGERDGDALDVGTKRVADEDEARGHRMAPWLNSCNCIYLAQTLAPSSFMQVHLYVHGCTAPMAHLPRASQSGPALSGQPTPSATRSRRR